MAAPPAGASALVRSLTRHAPGWTRLRERAVEALLLISALVAVLVTGTIVYVLFANSFAFFREVPLHEFLLGTDWVPPDDKWGVLPLLNGTLMVTLGAAAIAVPLGIGTAVYLSEFADPRVRAFLKPAIELLAGVPSIAFGLFAILVVSPILQDVFDADVFNALNAVIVLSFMVLPLVTSLAEDALRAVPQELRAGALALGATRWEVTRQVVVPAALSGIVAGVLLGFSRAIGETMAVTLAAGARPQLGLNFLESVQTMTAYIAQTAQGDVAHAGVHYGSLFAVGLLLFAITFAVNLLAAAVLRRYRQVY
ncbi:MAG TPA: phosphate ABC transporter permease subunit PstC [Candidatus Thermoplasmatota archaeon]|nr:phosphate ABC transporter permease subunit PstC [Candidatus Thermoplasmatota archaeon]